tara:strand:+ start:79 stop:504 length:426 start_codon:yes stop_codon:yes gene_type:complete
MPITRENTSTNVARKALTFTGATSFGEVGAVPLFTVTGEVIINKIIPYCTTNLAGGSATLSLGVTSGVADFVAATTATDVDANEFWVDTAPDANGVAIPAALMDIIITDNIIGTVATANITAGVMEFTVYWTPISVDGNVA